MSDMMLDEGVVCVSANVVSFTRCRMRQRVKTSLQNTKNHQPSARAALIVVAMANGTTTSIIIKIAPRISS